MRIEEYINDPFIPADAFEYVCGWLENIQNSMDALDRAYFVQAAPNPDVWREISGSFHSLQMAVSWVLLAADELLDHFPRNAG